MTTKQMMKKKISPLVGNSISFNSLWQIWYFPIEHVSIWFHSDLCFDLVHMFALTILCLGPLSLLEHNLFLWVTHNVMRVINVLDCVAKYKNMNLCWRVNCDDYLQSFEQCNTSIICFWDENFIFRFKSNLNTW